MKFVLFLIVAALASQATAQLRCIQCTNCASVPANRQIVTCAHPGVTTVAPPTDAPVLPPLPQETSDGAIQETPTQRRRRSAEEVDPSNAFHFSCFRLRTSATNVNRGCVANGGNTTHTCHRAANYGNFVEDCHICGSNECNTSSSLVASVLVVFALIFTVFNLY